MININIYRIFITEIVKKHHLSLTNINLIIKDLLIGHQYPNDREAVKDLVKNNFYPN